MTWAPMAMPIELTSIRTRPNAVEIDSSSAADCSRVELDRAQFAEDLQGRHHDDGGKRGVDLVRGDARQDQHEQADSGRDDSTDQHREPARAANVHAHVSAVRLAQSSLGRREL